MPGDKYAGSILDPVEMERQRLAEAEDRPSVPLEPGRRWTLAQKLAIAVSIGLITGYLALWGRSVRDNQGPEGYVRMTDFVSTLTGAVIIREGNGPLLYDLETQRAAQSEVLAPYRALLGGKMLPYNHLPFEALLIAPIIRLPYALIFALWTLAAGLAAGLSLGVMDGALPLTRPAGWVLSVAACSYLPLVRGLMLGQNSVLVLLGLCVTFATLKRGQQGWAGIALVLVALKPQVLPFVLLLLLLQGYWKAILTFAAMLVALGVAAVPALGAGWPIRYVQLLLGVAGWSDSSAIDPAIMQNWRGLATNLIGGWAPGLVTWLAAFLVLVSATVFVWAWARSRDASPRDSEFALQPAWDLLWALAVITALLASPHLNPHDLTILVFPAWIVAAYAATGEWRRGLSFAWIAILWTGYALAPLTLYADNSALPVVPGVLLMAGAAGLLAWQMIDSRRGLAIAAAA